MTFDWSAYAYVEYGGEVICVRKIKRGVPGLWGLPGGKREGWELFGKQTLVREIREEIGLQIRWSQATLVYKVMRRKRRGSKIYHYDTLFYLVSPTAAQMESCHAGTSEEEACQMSREKIDSEKGFSNFHRKVIRERLPTSHPEIWALQKATRRQIRRRRRRE